MKNSLVEELKRIHTLTYGEKSVNESFMDNLLKTVGYEKKDDPKKADLISGEVNDFFSTLENIKEPLTQQSYGSMTYQKNVESIQIALMLLGYELPRFGVDGMFGKETSNAVERFKSDNQVATTELSESNVQLDTTSYSNVKYDRDGTHKDMVNQTLLNDVQKAAKEANLTVTITTASSGHPSQKSNKPSRHKTNSAVDISIINGKNSGGATNNKNGDPEFRKLGDQLVNQLVKIGYVLNNESGNSKAIIWQSNMGGNHFNHVHVSNKGVKSNGNKVEPKRTPISNKSQGNQTVLTPDLIKIMVSKLKQRGVTPEELKGKMDSVSLDGLSEKNVYAKILQLLKAPITEENLKFMYAWRQAEGKGGINNPFNTTWDLANSSVMNKSGVRNYETLEDGINATIKTLSNKRYECIVNGLRRDIGSSNIAKCESLKIWGTGDLVSRVLIGYERGAKPNIQSLS